MAPARAGPRVALGDALISVSLLVLAALVAAIHVLPVLVALDAARLPAPDVWTGIDGPLIQAGAAAGGALAILFHYHRSIGHMAIGLFRLTRGRNHDGARLVGLLALANLPPLIGVFAVARFGAPPWLFSTATMAGLMLAGGLFLWFADRVGLTVRRIEHLDAGGALLIGLLRALAMVPLPGGLGMAVATARLLDYERPEALRIAALMALPWLAGTAVTAHLGDPGLATDLRYGLAVAVAALAGLAVLGFLAGWLKRRGFMPFVVAQVAAGLALFWTLYG